MENVWEGKSASGLEWQLYEGDAATCLKLIPDRSAQCVITSPPYFWLRDYGVEGQSGQEESVAGYVSGLADVCDQLYRILADDGVMFLNLGDTYYSGKGKSHGTDPKSKKRRFGLRAVDRSGGLDLNLRPKSVIGIPWRVAFELANRKWVLRSSIIWHRKHSLREAVLDRPRRSHENIFLLAKQRNYYFNREALKDVLVEEDVWSISARPKMYAGIDTAPYPDELVERCVALGCPPNGTVLDPYAGSGTTLRVALEQGRSAIGVELNPLFCQHIASQLSAMTEEQCHVLNFDVVRRSLDELSSFHPFFGITFLVCKLEKLPIGTSRSFEINNEEKKFLELFYQPDSASAFFFQPFRTSSREGRWLSPKYPSSGSQSTRTRGDFADAFFHEKNTKLWGWKPNYVNVLRKKLTTDRSGRLPIFWLAVWLYRNEEFGESPEYGILISRFIKEFHITDEERDEIFRSSIPDEVGDVWSSLPYTDSMLMRVVESPPDGKADEGATLRRLEIRGTGPVDLDFSPAQRLTVLTGDNGLGKSFILECAWWALTGEWAGRPATPRSENAKTGSTEIKVNISNQRSGSRVQAFQYDPATARWPSRRHKDSIPGLIVYARVDGSFAVWDPARHQRGEVNTASIFSREEVIDGDERRQIEGLIRDWISWQRESGSEAFELFRRVLRKLSPPDMAPLQPGPPVRVIGDVRTLPTLRHDYGDIPFTIESAGVKRIITIAYILVWSWNEHKVAAALGGRSPDKSIIVLIDEVESHLHPKWQRVVMPSLLDVLTYLEDGVESQVLVATHSPLILASCEEIFSQEVDKLFHLSLDRGHVEFTELPFLKYGTVDSWLTSEIFKLKQARSKRAESTVERVRTLMEEETPESEQILELNHELQQILPEDDDLWARWLFFARFHGVKL